MPLPETDGLEVHSKIDILEPGMYIFRYASPTPTDALVCFTLQATPLGKGAVDFFPAEGVTRNTLAKLGDCLIARIKGGPTGVLITEYRQADSADLRVDLRIDRIDTSEAIIAKAYATTAPAEERAEPIALTLAGHVERIGDTQIRGDWLGNPKGLARIEGFSVQWDDRPAGIDVAYQCSVRQIGQLPAVLSGGFVGTRQRATPIIAVAFALVGPRSDEFKLIGEAVFADGQPQFITPGEELHGPTGTEQLVALRLAVLPLTPQTEINAACPPSPWDTPDVIHSNGTLG
jgi:hypothetical protein